MLRTPSTVRAPLTLSSLLALALGCTTGPPDTGGGVHGSVYTVIGSAGEFGPAPDQIYLPDIEVFLHDISNKTDGAPIKTDFFGRYLFPKQAPGSYLLRWNAQLGWAAGAHPDTIVVRSITEYPVPARIRAAESSGVVSGRVSFADEGTPWSADDLFDINATATVTILNAARTTTLAGPVHVNGIGNYAAAGLPPSQSVTIRVESEAATITRAVASGAVSFGGNVAPTDVELPNKRPEIVDVVPMVGGIPVKTAAPGSIVTLSAVTRDGNGDPLTHSWRTLPGHGTIAPSGSAAQWTLSTFPGPHSAYLQVADGRGGYARHRVDFISAWTHVTFSGRAVDKFSGAAVAGAKVTVNGTAGTADGNGFFRITTPLDDRYVMNIRQSGYALFSRVVDAALTGQTWHLVPATSVPVDPSQPIQIVDQRPELEHKRLRGMRVRVPARALVDTNGVAPTGPLTAWLATLDVADGEAPGDWGAMVGGVEKNLISYGAGFVEFVDGTGKTYNLRPGASAEVELFAATPAFGPAPATTKAWSYNESTGYWEVSGVASKMPGSGSFINKVTHFSTINTDLEKDQAACLAAMIYPPISTGVKLRITDPSGAVFTQSFEFVLDAGINAAYRLPANTNVQLDLLEANGNPYGGTVLLEEQLGVPLAGNIVNTGPPIPAGQSLWPGEPYVPPCKLVILREANAPTATAFLNFKDGSASLATANAYYSAVDPQSNRETLREWWVTNGFQFPDVNNNSTLDDPDFGAPPTNAIRTSYLNDNDLGSGRDMFFLKKADGTVAAYVTNYGLFNQDHENANKAATRQDPGATVAMEFAPVEGEPTATKIVKFFVFAGNDFGPNAQRQTSADLDNFGAKFVPNLCMNCHGGGSYTGGTSFASVNLGSSFRELDIETYKFPDGRLAADVNLAEKKAFKDQNLIVRGANEDAISVKPIKDLIDGWYVGGTDDQDNSYTPPGWAGPGKPIYDDVIKRSCRTCHVALDVGSGSDSDLDWTTYGQVRRRHSILQYYVLCDGRIMPHALITYRNFWLSGSPHRPAVLRNFQDGQAWPSLGACQ